MENLLERMRTNCYAINKYLKRQNYLIGKSFEELLPFVHPDFREFFKKELRQLN
jgi:hypothetical protein